jgi:hypothetical protein
VWVVNWGKVPGGGSRVAGRRAGQDARLVAKAAKTVGRFAGPVGAAITAGELVHALFPSFGEKDAPSRAGGAAPRRQSERQIPAPGFGGGMPGALNITTQVVMDGRVVGQSTDTAKAREKARK